VGNDLTNKIKGLSIMFLYVFYITRLWHLLNLPATIVHLTIFLCFGFVWCVGSLQYGRQQQRQQQQRRRRRRRGRDHRFGANVADVAAAVPSESDGDHFHQRGAGERTGPLRQPADGRPRADGQQPADRWHRLQHHRLDDQADADGPHAARGAQGVRCPADGKVLGWYTTGDYRKRIP